MNLLWSINKKSTDNDVKKRGQESFGEWPKSLEQRPRGQIWHPPCFYIVIGLRMFLHFEMILKKHKTKHPNTTDTIHGLQNLKYLSFGLYSKHSQPTVPLYPFFLGLITSPFIFLNGVYIFYLLLCLWSANTCNIISWI